MNAAARVINQRCLFQGHLAKMQVSKQLFFQTALVVSMLLSALAVVYTINVHRVTCSQLQFLETEAHELQLQWGQLLLEQASLATPARVEQLATDQLHMVLPVSKQAFVLHTQ